VKWETVIFHTGFGMLIALDGGSDDKLSFPMKFIASVSVSWRQMAWHAVLRASYFLPVA
jgi:hypothetical protein